MPFDRKSSSAQSRFTFIAILIVALALMMVRFCIQADDLLVKMLGSDIDDLIRLTMWRDWLAGQDWFDTRQYRLLPPEGVSLHWSRYVDLGLALIFWPLQLIWPADQAEIATLLIWSGLIYALFLVLVGWGSQRAFGLLPALAALLFALLWSKFASYEFRAGRIDHHNLQILGAAAMLYAFGWAGERQDRSQITAGISAGLAMALCLAIGLEMLPVLLLIWLAAGLRMIWSRPGSALWLSGFLPSLGLAAPLLAAGQLAPADWTAPLCDVLALPLLSILLIAVVSCAIGLWARTHWPNARPWSLLALTFVTFGLGLALIWPIWGQCLRNGPYAMMPPEARALIPERVLDALPLREYARRFGQTFDHIMLPLFSLGLAAAALGWSARRHLPPAQRIWLWLCLGITLLGVLASLNQFRAMILAAPALPLLAAFVTRLLITRAQDKGFRPQLPIALLLVALTLNPLALSSPLRALFPPKPKHRLELASAVAPCFAPQVLSTLNALPPAQMIVMTNMAGPLLVMTHHSTPTAPYHRAGEAFWHGHDPFLDRDAMMALIKARAPDYLMFCTLGKDARLPAIAPLIAGDLPAWLEAMPSPDPVLQLFRIRADLLP